MPFRLQLKVSPYLLSLVDEVIKETGGSRTATMERLLYAIELLAKNNLFPKEMGLDFYGAAHTLNANGMGAKHLDPVMMDGGEHVDIDVKLLETSAKSKSSFAGVYATSGGSFRAMVPDFAGGGGTKYLASRPTALRAAIDRYEYFTQYGLPYGNIGKHVEHWKKMRPEWSMDEIIEALRLVPSSGMSWPFTEAELEAWLERHHAMNPQPPLKVTPAQLVKDETYETWTPTAADGAIIGQPLADRIAHAQQTTRILSEPEKPTSRLAAVPDIVLCVLCKEEISGAEPFGPYGKKRDDYAHVSCINDHPTTS